MFLHVKGTGANIMMLGTMMPAPAGVALNPYDEV
jgi:hypothetical protein